MRSLAALHIHAVKTRRLLCNDCWRRVGQNRPTPPPLNPNRGLPVDGNR